MANRRGESIGRFPIKWRFDRYQAMSARPATTAPRTRASARTSRNSASSRRRTATGGSASATPTQAAGSALARMTMTKPWRTASPTRRHQFSRVSGHAAGYSSMRREPAAGVARELLRRPVMARPVLRHASCAASAAACARPSPGQTLRFHENGRSGYQNKTCAEVSGPILANPSDTTGAKRIHRLPNDQRHHQCACVPVFQGTRTETCLPRRRSRRHGR